MCSEGGVSNVLYAFWRPVCLLEVASWHKWLHTHRVGLILEHDAPLPRTLHNITNNNRCSHVTTSYKQHSLLIHFFLNQEFRGINFLRLNSYANKIFCFTMMSHILAT